MIIAEACQNHNGELSILKDMVWQAKEAGADAVKIQSFFAKDLSDEWKQSNPYDFDRLEGLELSLDDHAEFVRTCHKAKIEPMTSVYTKVYADALHEMGFRHVKLGSAQNHDSVLMTSYRDKGFNVIISTGGTPKFFPVTGVYGVLHCVSKYPHTFIEANLNRMLKLMATHKYMIPRFGFSDHSDPTVKEWNDASMVAITLGAEIIERHYTILPRDKTKDGKVSITTDQLKDLCVFDQSDDREQIEKVRATDKRYGILFSNQSNDETKLINGYRKRWNAS